jgi:hypothetical protein
MCDKCRQLETDIQRYRKRLEQSDPLILELQRSRKLLALGLDPLTMQRVDGVIRELVHKPAFALAANASLARTNTGFPFRYGRKGAGLLARVIH